MTALEKAEVALLATATGATAMLSAALPHRVALADLLLGGAAFLLLQGLVRDVARLARARRNAVTATLGVQCVCVESTVGVAAIVAGSVLLFAWTPVTFHASRAAWPAGVAALGAFGFFTRNVVFDWRVRRFGRDPTHSGRLAS